MFVIAGRFHHINMRSRPHYGTASLSASDLAHQIRKGNRRLHAEGAEQLISICYDKKRPQRDRSEALHLLQLMKIAGTLRSRERHAAIENLPDLFKEDNPRLAWGAASLLASIGTKSKAQRLRSVVNSSMRVEVRRSAIYGLRMLGVREAAGELTSVLENKKETPGIRAEAAEALASCGFNSKSALRALIRSLEDQSVEVRFFSAFSLGLCALYQTDLKEEMSEAATQLQKLLKDRASLGSYGTVANEASEALHHIRSRKRARKKH
jgi:HEAT repeat protein